MAPRRRCPPNTIIPCPVRPASRSSSRRRRRTCCALCSHWIPASPVRCASGPGGGPVRVLRSGRAPTTARSRRPASPGLLCCRCLTASLAAGPAFPRLQPQPGFVSPLVLFLCTGGVILAVYVRVGGHGGPMRAKDAVGRFGEDVAARHL